jgi:hypothetical protein
MMSSLRDTASWVIVRLDDGKPVFETFCYEFADTINKARYKAVPILEYLQTFNARIKNENL